MRLLSSIVAVVLIVGSCVPSRAADKSDSGAEKIYKAIDPAGAAQAKLSEARTMLLTQRPLDMHRFATLIEEAHQLAPSLDRKAATIIRRQVILHAGLGDPSGTIAGIEWAVRLDPALALDDTLVQVCNFLRQYPANVRDALGARRAEEEKERGPDEATPVVVVPFKALPEGTLQPIDSPTLGKQIANSSPAYWPRVLTKVSPEDPRGPGAPAAETKLTVEIERRGPASNVRALSGPTELRRAAVVAVRQWTFQPYRFLGNDVPCVAEVVVTLGQEQRRVRTNDTKDGSTSTSATDGHLPKFGDYVYVEELPEAIKRVLPEYSGTAREKNIEGTVLVQVLVGSDGHVKDTRIVKSIPELDEAAVSAARQWIFKPALTGNKPVAVWVAVPMRFPPK